MKFRIRWIDSGREPQWNPDPDYPDGIELNFARTGERSCFTLLPYPARRIGAYIIICETCGMRVLGSTAGRPDDPRSAVVPCRRQDRAA